MRRPSLIIKAAILVLVLSSTLLAQEPSPAAKPPGPTVQLKESSPTRMSSRDKAEKLLNTLAAESGGRAFFPKDKSELNVSIAQIVHDLQGQFRLTYQSSNGEKKGFRNVEVKLVSQKDEKRKVIVPRGYETQ